MRINSAIVALSLVTGCTTQNVAFLDADSQGLCSGIVITRPGENGKVNADECVVELGEVQKGIDPKGRQYSETIPYERYIMHGEERVAAIVRPGTYTLYVHSYDSYDRWCTNNAVWRSNRLVVNVEAKQVVACFIEYVGHDDGQAWRLDTDRSESGTTTGGR